MDENSKIVEDVLEISPQESATIERKTPANNWQVDRIMKYETLLHKVLKVPEAKALVSLVGYTEARVKEGEALLNKVKELAERQNVAIGRAHSLTQTFNQQRDELHREYMQHLVVARNVLAEDTGLLDMIKAKGARSLRFNHWKAGVETFYENAIGHEAIKTRLVASLLTEKQLKDSQKKFSVLMNLHLEKIAQRDEGRKLTQEKNMALKLTREWFTQFQKVLRSAYLRDPVKRTILGI